jgi:predicted Rossmann-fold nucleotide-binding protein
MDEVFETLTLIQTHKITPIPIVLFGGEFWRDIINWELFLKRGFISPDDLDTFRICETAEEGWQFIRNFWNYNDVDVTP